MTKISMFSSLRRMLIAKVLLFALVLLAPVIPSAIAQSGESVSVPSVVVVEEESGGITGLTEYMIAFQRRANAEISTHMNAIGSGEDLGAFFLGLSIAFLYGVFHAFGPGHGKFIIISYFLGA